MPIVELIPYDLLTADPGRITVNQITHFVIPLMFGVVGSVAGFAAVFLTNAGGLIAGGYLSLRNHAASRSKQ